MKRVLIANRGEIACRIIKTCRRLGIETVAVYSDADAESLHTELADYTVHIGASEAKSSYLDISKIVAAAKASKADAVHPGYGFLSENPDFATALEKKKIKFIGPSAKVIELLGDKVAAKELARKVNAPLVPSVEIDAQSVSSGSIPKAVQDFVRKNGLPVIIKARAGGGGRGMRKITKNTELVAGLQSAAREALTFFNDGRLFIEKLVENARHIEVQIFGDCKGNVVVIGDRDCSMQRHHQKVIEEAPAPNLSHKLRKEIHACAQKICSKAGYVGAGTVEFLLDSKGKFYFLEVNSRLQVEHPVTEAVTCLDLVELQIRVASGESIKNLKPTSTGHAIEVRICAESPEEGFKSSTGQLTDFSLAELEDQVDVRIDTGFRVGDLVSHYYDSLLAKVITRGDTRSAAIANAEELLSNSSISGVASNIGFALKLLRSEEFWTSTHHIQFAESILPSQAELHELGLMFGGLLTIAQLGDGALDNPWQANGGFRIHGAAQQLFSWKFCGQEIRVGVRFISQDIFEIYSPERRNLRSGEIQVLARDFSPGDSSGLLTFYRGEDEESLAYSLSDKGHLWVNSSFGSYQLTPSEFKLKRATAAKEMDSESLVSPLPGKIVGVKVKKGEKVKEGSPLLILESMKMEHIIKAPRDAAVVDVLRSMGDIIESDSPLVVLDYRAA